MASRPNRMPARVDNPSRQMTVVPAIGDDYRFDPQARIWRRDGGVSLSYTDGERFEARLREQLAATTDLGTLSAEIAAMIVDWPSEAHLSGSRANLLRPLSFSPGMRILEVGAGCGALTRYLGETGASVHALEGAIARAGCAAERCRDLSNVTVICDELTRYRGPVDYDVVMLVGVLEYARLFVEGEDPVQAALAHALKHLSRAGVLLLAIENQLGLKYFNGCNEDHLGAPYAGVTDLYGPKSPVTFGRAELARRLACAGFKRTDWYFPFPDYKLPTTIVAERAFERREFSVGDLLFGEYARDHGGGVHRNFDEAAVWSVLARNGVVPDLANSFLVVASAGDGNPLDPDPDWLAHRYSAMRTPRFSTDTVFRTADRERIVVEKARLAPVPPESPSLEPIRIRHRLGEQPYVRGSSFARAFANAVAQGLDASGIAATLTPWIGYLVAHAHSGHDVVTATPWSQLTLPGEFVDCVPFNLIVTESGALEAIDLELEVEGRIPLPWVVLRGVVHTASRCFGHRYLADRTSTELVGDLMPKLGFGDIDDWSPYIALEDALIRTVLRPWRDRPKERIFDGRLRLPAATYASSGEVLSRIESEARASTRHADAAQHALDAIGAYAGAAVQRAADDGGSTTLREALAAALGSERSESVTSDLDALTARARERDEFARALEQRSTFDAGVGALMEALARQEHQAWQQREQREQALQEELRTLRTAAAAQDAQRVGRISQLETELADRTNQFAQYAERVAQREQALHEQLRAVTAQAAAQDEQRLARIGQLEADVDANVSRTGELEKLRQEQASEAEQLVRRIGELEADVAASIARGDELNKSLADAIDDRVGVEQMLTERANDVSELEDQIAQMERAEAVGHGEIESLRQRILEIEQRESQRALQTWRRATRDAAFRSLRRMYKLLPLNERARRVAKRLFYRRFGEVFANHQGYQLWKAMEATTEPRVDTTSVPTDVAAAVSPSTGFEPSARSISIVIPAYGKAAMTRACIESVLRSHGGDSCEMIVVDDGSPEPLAPALADLPGVEVLRNDTNRGFIASCNRGGEAAGGSLLLFLNNDTEVAPDSIQAMAATFDRNPDAGIVGCKLVFPDGRLQEAGCYIRPDGNAEMIGLWDDPNRARYNFERDVAYCSGACFMIDRALFLELKGFDTAFEPAYCEDSDLCFRVRAAGKRVVYQPRASVTHALSASMQESPIDKGAVIAVNQRRFLDRWSSTLQREDQVRAIAFYLPQYHPIPENDRWWGKGFTEWSNVARARPTFEGHLQPNVPADLGYYDLRLPIVRAEQARLAREAGLFGFCYYYYWFGGTRLLTGPLDAVVSSGEPDFPFCICWANENWTRRWDGLDSEILIAQRHSVEDDIAFLESVLPALRDRRYIRVHGKPLLLVYRPSLLPDAAATTRRWREHATRLGLPGLYLVSTQSFFHIDARGPDAFGFDAAVEFPPHSFAVECAKQPRGFGGRSFAGKVYDYARTADNFMSRELPAHKVFRAVMPRWDNTARRGSHANVFVGSAPEAYREWLNRAVDYTRQFYYGDERMLFINAWNEWGEGNYLEPDLRFGHTYLDATRSVLAR